MWEYNNISERGQIFYSQASPGDQPVLRERHLVDRVNDMRLSFFGVIKLVDKFKKSIIVLKKITKLFILRPRKPVFITALIGMEKV
jgi:hypothetical protein